MKAIAPLFAVHAVLVLSNTRVFHFDRGASLVRFEYEAPGIQKKERWKCELQEVNGIWVPKRTESTIEAIGQGLIIHNKMEWKDQILNEDVAMELSPTTLGACQGDQAYNYKTGTLYLIEDKDYPVYEKRELPSRLKQESARVLWVIGLNVILVLIAATLVLVRIRRKAAKP